MWRSQLVVLAIAVLCHSGCNALRAFTPTKESNISLTLQQQRQVSEIAVLRDLVPGLAKLHVASHANALFVSGESPTVTRVEFSASLLSPSPSVSGLEFPTSVESCAASASYLCCVGILKRSITCKKLTPNGIQLGQDVPISIESWTDEDEVLTLTSGKAHFCLLSSTGRVFCWGSDNNHFKLGVGLPESSQVLFQVARLVNLPLAIGSLSCGGDSCAALPRVNSTTVFAWGALSRHIVSTHRLSADVPWVNSTTLYAGAQVNVDQIYAFNQTVVVTKNGTNDVFVFGRLDTGVAGHCELMYTTTTPLDLIAPSAAFQVAAKLASSNLANRIQLFPSESNLIGISADKTSVFGWGSNRDSQLGRTLYSSSYLCPHSIEFMVPGSDQPFVPDRIIHTSVGTLLLYDQ